MSRARNAAPAAAADIAERGSTGSSAERSLRLLALLADAGRPMSLADLGAHLGLPKGTAHRICLQLSESGFLTLDVGSHVPLHCTASGKLFLAMMPAEEREAVIERIALPRMTARTLVTKKALRAECEAIAAAGHSCDREEFIAGLIAVAVPVGSPNGPVRAAIAVHAPTARMSLKQALAKLAALKAAAAKMQELV